MKHLNLTILALLVSLASFAQIAAITGPSTVCPGSSITLADATAGGTWTLSSGSIATITSTTGVLTAVAAGVTTVTYTIGASNVTYSVTVNALPDPIGCAPSVCVGGTVIPTDLTTGGTWSATTMTVVSISPLTGGITGVAAGTATIIYTLPTGCSTTFAITVNPSPSAITGTPLVCGGGTTTLSDGTGGGIWSSSNMAVATVGSSSGVVTGVSFGTASIYYVLSTSCSTTTTVTVSAAPATFTVAGGGSYCAGGSGDVVGLSGSSAGVSYQLYNGSVAVGSAVAGTGTAISFGAETAPGTYTVEATAGGGCSATMTSSAVIVVNPLPNVYAVTGGGAYCAGGAGVPVGLDASDVGVNYQLYNGSSVVGASIPGAGAALDFGLQTAAGVYTVVATNAATACSNIMSGSATITINPLPTAFSISSGGSYCAGGAGVDITLSSSYIGINYQLYVGSSPVGTAIAGSGLALDFGLQTAAGTYTVVAMDATTGCTNNMTGTAIITIDPLPTVTASATTASCGGMVTLSASGAVSYSWSPSTGLSCSACASATLLPTGSATYTVIGTDGSGCVNTATASVDGNSISGYISYTGTPSAGDLKIWLIQFDPTDSVITATDSTTNCINGGMAYYQFMDEPTGNYMVKADLLSSVPGTSGYIPTYSLSTPHWDSAATISHSGSADSMHINMVYGTVPSGPGFISGYVVSGAGRNTSTGIPAVGMLIYLKDASGNVITYKYTAADGSYSFSSLANGSYIIYPEAYKYYTTQSAVINLSTAEETVTNVNFKQHTSYGTITPNNTTGVQQVSATKAGITMYPNPTTGNLNIQWEDQATGMADMVITDMTGRETFRSGININAASGQAQINVNDLSDGVYLITIKSDKVYYSCKLVKQQ